MEELLKQELASVTTELWHLCVEKDFAIDANCLSRLEQQELNDKIRKYHNLTKMLEEEQGKDLRR